jgi:hypothetical protein
VNQSGVSRALAEPPEPPGSEPIAHDDDSSSEKPLTNWGNVFVYPVRGAGKYILPVGAVGLLLGSWLAGAANIREFGSVWAEPRPFASLLGATWLIGFILLYVSDLIGTSARGDIEPPLWPVIRHWTDTFRGAWVVLAPVAFSFFPAVALRLWQGSAHPWLYLALLTLGWIYCPMAILGMVLWESADGLSPLRVLPAIVKTMPAYLLSLPMMPLVYLMSMSSVSGVGRALMAVLTMYLLMVMGRTLGVIYRTYAHCLQWF